MELFKTIEVNLGALYDKVFEKAYGLSCLQSLSITYIPPTKRHLSISRLVKTLIDAKAVPEGLGPEIITLIKYRNALVHTNDVDPSQHMVRNAQIVNEEIKRLLEEY
ncbi:hypothetical protein [Scandinavium sp.]|uniref:hypothetical protein n=1 Tax=Scandinavium sp. TaxID=2830653 RepID=UPI00289FB6A8|nr:hypothetical protein [Scandinavium sp.]